MYYLAIFLLGVGFGGLVTYLVYVPILKIYYKDKYKLTEATINCKYSNFNPYNYKTNVKVKNNKIVYLDCKCLSYEKKCINSNSDCFNKPCPFAKHIKYF